jgi:hypothetical protein
VSQLLLPDVSTLPLSAIVEMRERTKDVLNPMRAELLRFTETLRELVGDAQNDGQVIRAEEKTWWRRK